MTKLAGVCAPRLDGNRRALKRRDAFQIDQTRREISLLTTLLRDEWRERERERERGVMSGVLCCTELDEKATGMCTGPGLKAP